ncbi:MAG: translation initiation factor IF-3 [Anaerolineae bacterium]|nr:translation initiation factor IF-3 [Anaerolineae bacterium]MCO5186851.1 translation initiation factor IF-3 [Anaerolineae bacterium]MCO5194478.1 translation initiation factor IF-3 [Anaerolineae bacterium]MCO5197660.1 translation initiation factor IF-3 [Anaerolineae bacterium]MCO5203716.1 translation initiation factor IF-3 [Anaerolineae bacterium]
MDHNGKNHGVVDTRDALQMAIDADLDLVEVAPAADPPVARIIDYSKFIYEKHRKEREARKNQKTVEIKTIRLKVKTSDFHRDIQIKKARGWLEEGKKVKAEIRFYAREITMPELGRAMMDTIWEELKDIAVMEQAPQMDRRTMVMMLAPANEKS